MYQDTQEECLSVLVQNAGVEGCVEPVAFRKGAFVTLYEWLAILVPGSVGVATVAVMVVALIRQERGNREDRMD
jgi:hypothetical protein